MNLLEVHVRSDQQLSRIFSSLQKNNTFTQDHIATLKFKTADTPFQCQGEDIILNVQMTIAKFDYCPALKWSLTIIWLVILNTFTQMKKTQK